MVQRIERRFPMPEICVRFALGPQKCPRGVMESTKHYGCFGGGSNPPGGTKWGGSSTMHRAPLKERGGVNQ